MTTKLVNRIKGYRNLLGFTQSELSNLLGITPQALSAKENGKSSFTDQEKIIIYQVIKKEFPTVTIEDLFFIIKEKQDE